MNVGIGNADLIRTPTVGPTQELDAAKGTLRVMSRPPYPAARVRTAPPGRSAVKLHPSIPSALLRESPCPESAQRETFPP